MYQFAEVRRLLRCFFISMSSFIDPFHVLVSRGPHEVDVIAEKDNQHFMIECKFHNDSSRNCNVKIPLYTQSRFLDILKRWEKMPGHTAKFHQG